MCWTGHLRFIVLCVTVWQALPSSAKVAKDGKDTIQECVSEFVSFITSEASDKCQREKRKTINGDDILWAMSTLGFDKYIEPLKVYLSRYVGVQSGRLRVVASGGLARICYFDCLLQYARVFNLRHSAELSWSDGSCGPLFVHVAAPYSELCCDCVLT